MDQVTIVIPFFNCPYIDRSIKSALNQTYPNIEVIVIDDGSTKYTEKAEPYLSKIRYIKKENGGTAEALNAGIRNASGNYFAWLSSDDIYDPEKIAKQSAFMKDNQASVSYTNYHLINCRDEIIGGPFNLGFSTRKQFYRRMLRDNIVNGCTVMVKKGVVDETGVFDESLKYAHDYELWLRILQKFHFYYMDQPYTRYRIHDDMGSKKHSDAIAKEELYVKQRYKNVLRNLIRNPM